LLAPRLSPEPRLSDSLDCGSRQSLEPTTVTISFMWIHRKVQKGTGTGAKISFPTLNFNVGNFGEHHSKGVYLSEVKINKTVYKSALFFGPRLNSRRTVLEIYVFGFNKMIYNRFVSFKVIKKIRNPKTFKDLKSLKKQITEDLKNF